MDRDRQFAVYRLHGGKGVLAQHHMNAADIGLQMLQRSRADDGGGGKGEAVDIGKRQMPRQIRLSFTPGRPGK